jgi:hypothetical protein
MTEGTLSLARGDDQNVGLTINNPDGSPYNISGCAVIFTARESSYFSPILFTKSGTDHIDNSLGQTQIVFVPSDTSELDDTTRYFDIKLQNVSGKISTLIYGKLFILPSS